MAEGEDKDAKTEQPTAARLARAREQGQVPVSRELNHWFIIGGGTLVLLAFAPHLAHTIVDNLRNFIAKPQDIPDDARTLEDVFTDTVIHAGMAIALPMILLLVAAIVGPLLQAGFMISTTPLTPKFSKISPMAGFHRLFSKKAVIEFLKNLVKLSIIGTVAFMLVKPTLPTLEHLIEMNPIQVIEETRRLVLRLAVGVLSALTGIMLVDVIYQRIIFIAQLRMTRQEVKEENRQNEGDPLIKQRLRQIRLQRARVRMMANIPKADVIITNPTHYAVALQYDPIKMTAPKCLAKGQDLIALKIREIATENKVAIVENVALARALYPTVEIDQEIPPEHYKAVAEVISYVFRLRGRSVKV